MRPKCVIGLNGEPRRLTLEGAHVEPRWSPSGRWLAFRSGKGDLTVMRADGNTSRTVIGIEFARSTWAWSPAADRLAYVTRRGGLVVEDADGSNRRELAAPGKGGAGTGVRHIAWSPDGEWIAYDHIEILKAGQPPERYASLWRIRIDGGEATELLDAGKPSPYGFIVAGWSSDGSHILYWIDPVFSASLLADGAPLFALPAGGGAPREITQTMLAYPDFLAASPDGAQLAVIEGGGRETWSNKRLVVMNLLSGEHITLTDDQLTALSPAWSLDGQRLAYVAAPDIGFVGGGDEARAGAAQRRIWIVSVENHTASPRLLTDDPAYRDERPLWSADGSVILFARLSTEDHTSLWLISADGGEPQRVVNELTPGPDWFRYYGYIDWETFYDWWRGTQPEGAQPSDTAPAASVEPTITATGSLLQG